MKSKGKKVFHFDFLGRWPALQLGDSSMVMERRTGTCNSNSRLSKNINNAASIGIVYHKIKFMPLF
jgi:hypothetical protein